MNYALYLYGDHAVFVEVFKMDIMIKLFLAVYLLAMVLLTILSIVCVLTAIFTPEWSSKNTWLLTVSKKIRARI